MNIFIIHGAYGTPEENWFPWLKKELEQNEHTVFIPRFPTPENQELSIWLHLFKEEYLLKVDEKTIFIGHSLGPAFILNLIEKFDIKPCACFFIAGFYSFLDNKMFDEINKSFINNDLDWDKIKKNCNYFFLINSKDDPYVLFSKGKELSNKLNGELKLFENGGHFNTESNYLEFEYLLNEILVFISKI